MAPPLTILLVANLVFDLTGVGYAHVGTRLLETTRGAVDVARDAVEAAGAITWATLALVYITASICATSGALHVLNNRLSGQSRRAFMICVLALSVVGLAKLALVDLTGLTLRAVFAVTFNALSNSPGIGTGRVAVIGTLVGLINVISVLVSALLLVAAAAATSSPAGGWTERTLMHCGRQVRRVIAFAATFMVAGVLHMGAWTHLAGTTLSATGDTALDHMAVSVTLFWGTTFALMIASFYIPVAVWQVAIAEGIMDKAGIDIANRPQWLRVRGLSFRLSEQLPQLAAMAAPLLASPVSAALGAVAASMPLGR